jgi:PAS domain S-box-containing protein
MPATGELRLGEPTGSFSTVQQNVFDLIATGAQLPDILGRLASGVEALLGEGLVTILVAEDGVLRYGAAPSVAPAYVAATDGFPIVPNLGSCLAAAASGETVIVEDIASHPYWAGSAHLATSHGLQACWSMPVLSADRDVLGTFAVYYTRPATPPEAARQLVAAATAVAAVAIRHEQTQHALRVSEERFRQMADTIDEVFWLQDAHTFRVLYVSPAFESIWGLPRAALYEDVNAALRCALPEDRHAVEAALAVTDDYSEAEFRIRRPDGSIRWLRAKRLPVQRPGQAVTSLVGVIHDVTERKELERQFLQAQRVESLGTLASGVAHDLNNVLTPILMAASALRTGLPEPARGEMLKAIEDSARRGAALVQQVLSFARGAEGEYRPLSLADVVADVVRLMRDTVPRGIDIATQVPATLPTVLGDTTQLHQVLLNLVVNARDAMPEGGRITITAGAADGEGTVFLAVSDTGTGIALDIQDRIFDPFFTTKPTGYGSGLGLSTVATLVRGHGGEVSVESTPGQGSTFRITLPVAPDIVTARTADADTRPAVRDGAGAVVLLVDDEPAILSVVKLGLERYGYHVLAAESGPKALALLQARQGQVAFVLLDVMMPDMDGIALAGAIATRYPGVPMAAATGLPSEHVLARLREVGVIDCLTKPYDVRRLLRLIEARQSQSAT